MKISYITSVCDLPVVLFCDRWSSLDLLSCTTSTIDSTRALVSLYWRWITASIICVWSQASWTKLFLSKMKLAPRFSLRSPLAVAPLAMILDKMNIPLSLRFYVTWSYLMILSPMCFSLSRGHIHLSLLMVLKKADNFWNRTLHSSNKDMLSSKWKAPCPLSLQLLHQIRCLSIKLATSLQNHLVAHQIDYLLT